MLTLCGLYNIVESSFVEGLLGMNNRRVKGVACLVICYSAFLSFNLFKTPCENSSEISASKENNLENQNSIVSQLGGNDVGNDIDMEFGNLNKDGLSELGNVDFLSDFERYKSLALKNEGGSQFKPASNTSKDIMISGKAAKYIEGKVESNFYSSAHKAGVPNNVIKKFYEVLGSKVNFKSSLKNGDVFKIVYDQSENLLFASLNTRKHEYKIYAYKSDKNQTEYMLANGEPAVNKGATSFRQPIPGARISSGYGIRKHPVFGVVKNHTGVDYAASYGTPVRCAYNGYVSAASYDSGYGRYVEVTHAGGYKTKYAHLSKSSVKRGQKVSAGTVLGAVGSSGISTGPHLHFELAKNGVRINPLTKVKFAPQAKLCGAKLSKFVAHRNAVDKAISRISSTQEI